MSIATQTAEQQTIAAASERPTPEAIDAKAKQYLDAKAYAAGATDAAKKLEEELVAMVQSFGVVPAGAEKSRRLSGRLAELTVTKSDTITVNAERVETLKDMLDANGHVEIFSKLFAVQTKYEIVDGAESVLKEVSVAKRLGEKILNYFGRCITVKPKKPSLKVTIADPAKPAKRRAQKKH